MTLVQPRLVIASALVLVLIAAVGIVGWTQLRTAAAAYDELVDRDARLTEDALELRVAVNEEAVGVRGFLLSRGDTSHLETYRAAVAEFERQLDEARSRVDSVRERRTVEEIERRHAVLQGVYAREIELGGDGRFERAAGLAASSGMPRRVELVSAVDELATDEAADLSAGRAEAGAVQRTAELAVVGVLALALLAGATAAVLGLRAARRRAGDREELERARRTAAEEAALARIATAIAQEQEPRAVLTSAAEEARRLLGTAAAAILRFETGRHTALVVGQAGTGGIAAGQRLRLNGDDVIGTCHSSEAPAGAEADFERCDVPLPLSPAETGAELAVPILVGGAPWGALWVASEPGEDLSENAGDRLVRFAELASASITGADARAHLAQLALEDSLTGLANHRHFHERLRGEVARARRHGRELAIVLFDIDHFKDVNDLHGHHVGDLLLRETADRLARCARSTELVARVGGEQFGWILPEAGGLSAYQAAERARRAVSAEPMAEGVTVTVSAGVCDLEHASSSAELLRFADGALFWAKAHGRDITFRYSPEVVTGLSADEQMEHLRRTRTIVGIRALARAVDVKDHSTARHSERVADLAVSIARELGWHDRETALLHEAALVHDVGKIGVPDAILLKPCRLDEREYEQIKQHAALGAEIVNDVLSEEQVSWVLGHHERFDGRGYPLRLDGAAIPAGARILAVADAWDVMTSERPYSAGRSPAEALREMRRQAGRQFCPAAVEALEREMARRTAELPADPGR